MVMHTHQFLGAVFHHALEGSVKECEAAGKIHFMITVLDIFNDGPVSFLAGPQACLHAVETGDIAADTHDRSDVSISIKLREEPRVDDNDPLSARKRKLCSERRFRLKDGPDRLLGPAGRRLRPGPDRRHRVRLTSGAEGHGGDRAGHLRPARHYPTLDCGARPGPAPTGTGCAQ